MTDEHIEIHVLKFDKLYLKLIKSTKTILNEESHRLGCDLDRQEVIKQLLRQFDRDIIESSIFIHQSLDSDDDDLMIKLCRDIKEEYRTQDKIKYSKESEMN